MTNSARATGARIDISHLTKTYGSQRAVDDVSVSVEPGAVSYTHLTLPTSDLV